MHLTFKSTPKIRDHARRGWSAQKELILDWIFKPKIWLRQSREATYMKPEMVSIKLKVTSTDLKALVRRRSCVARNLSEINTAMSPAKSELIWLGWSLYEQKSRLVSIVQPSFTQFELVPASPADYRVNVQLSSLIFMLGFHKVIALCKYH